MQLKCDTKNKYTWHRFRSVSRDRNNRFLNWTHQIKDDSPSRLSINGPV